MVYTMPPYGGCSHSVGCAAPRHIERCASAERRFLACQPANQRCHLVERPEPAQCQRLWAPRRGGLAEEAGVIVTGEYPAPARFGPQHEQPPQATAPSEPLS